MLKSDIEIDNPVALAGVTLIPVVRVWSNCWPGNKGMLFFGVKQPIGMVAISPSMKKAFWITGEEVPLDRFIQEVPGIKEVLEKM